MCFTAILLYHSYLHNANFIYPPKMTLNITSNITPGTPRIPVKMAVM